MTLREAIDSGTLREYVSGHVATIEREGFGVRCPMGEMIVEADAAIVDGEMVWRNDVTMPGRFLTERGSERLEAFRSSLEGPRP